MNDRIIHQFPGGTVVKARPTKAQLLDSGRAWLTLAQQQATYVRFWTECENASEIRESLKVLASHIDHARRAFAEAEGAK
jgi:hypothetical protein